MQEVFLITELLYNLIVMSSADLRMPMGLGHFRLMWASYAVIVLGYSFPWEFPFQAVPALMMPAPCA
jgi:hypothetical protein